MLNVKISINIQSLVTNIQYFDYLTVLSSIENLHIQKVYKKKDQKTSTICENSSQSLVAIVSRILVLFSTERNSNALNK